MWNDLNPDAAHELLASETPPAVLDVRTEPEYHRHRIAGARLLPIQELAERVGELDPSIPHLVVCEHGVRSVAACEFLEAQGFTQLTNLSGGMAHWVASGLPVDTSS